MRSLILVAMLVANGCGKSDQPAPTPKFEAAGYRETSEAERTAGKAALAAAKLPLPAGWEPGFGDLDGERSYQKNQVTVELYLAAADELVAAVNEPVTTLDELVARAKPQVRDGWPFWARRFTALADKGSAGTDISIRGPLQSNDECGDEGCRDAWHDSAYVGFVMYRSLGPHRFRCGVHGLVLGGGNPALDEAIAACKALALWGASYHRRDARARAGGNVPHHVRASRRRRARTLRRWGWAGSS